MLVGLSSLSFSRLVQENVEVKENFKKRVGLCFEENHVQRLFCSLNKLLLFTIGVFTPRIWLHIGPCIVNSVQECIIFIINKLFYNKESVKFPMHYFQFSKQTFISKANYNVVSMLYTLIEHATISQSESLLEWFK